MKTAIAYYDPRYYAANVFDPDGYSLEATPPIVEPRNFKEPRPVPMQEL
jgi:hypothetical protein